MADSLGELRIPPSSSATSGTGSTGVYLPSDWGAIWTAAKAASGSTLARVAVVGDSISQGFWTSDPLVYSWVARLRAALQTKYGDGGSGLIHGAWSQAFLTAAASAASAAYRRWTVVSGSWSADTSSSGWNGPGANAFYTGSAAGSAETTVVGSRITVYYANFPSGVATAQPFKVTIDGVDQTTVSPTNVSWSISSVTYTVAAGSHTVRVTGTGTGTFIIYGVRGYNTSGVVVDFYGGAGYKSSNFKTDATANTATMRSELWSPGVNIGADLIIYAIGLNDVATNVTPDTYMLNVHIWLEAQRNAVGISQGADLLILRPHAGRGWEGSAWYWPDYNARLQALARQYGAAVVDIGAIYRSSWAYFNSLGGWSDDTSSGSAGTSTAHPSNVGHGLYYDALVAGVPALIS